MSGTRRGNRLPHVVACMLLGAAVIVLAPACAKRPATHETVELRVHEPRALAAVAKVLEERHGWTVTYEDPPYVHSSDMDDVTGKVRKDLHKHPPGQAPRVLVPKKVLLRLSYAVGALTGHPEDPAAVIQQLLDAHAAAGNPGVFRLHRSGEFLHIIPAMVKGEDGQLVPVESVLERRISLPERERTGLEMMEAFCRALNEVTPRRVTVGTIPINMLAQHRCRLGAAKEPARDVLERFLRGVEPRLSWGLYYGPDVEWYGLNLHRVRSKRYAP